MDSTAHFKPPVPELESVILKLAPIEAAGLLRLLETYESWCNYQIMDDLRHHLVECLSRCAPVKP